MKMNAPKRKIFDAVDLLIEDKIVVAESDVQMLSVDAIHLFANHPFHLYEGDRLDDMVESIREHGVLVPVIVRQTEKGYEMLAGHNRQKAARLAGIMKIPAIVKKDLSDEDAYVYVIETNVIQRATNGMSVKIPAELREKYFAGASVKDVTAIVEQALEAWFDGKEDHHV